MAILQHARVDMTVTADHLADPQAYAAHVADLSALLLASLPANSIVRPGLPIHPDTPTRHYELLPSGVRLIRVTKNGQILLTADVAYEVPEA